MKKTIRNILILLLALTASLCLAVSLAACDKGVKLESLSIENAKTVFMVGDDFEYGENFKVYANFSDGTKSDVTQEVEIKKEIGFDMNVAGNYQLTVIYGNKREIYTIYVSDFENQLRKLTLDTSNVKTVFELGEKVSLDGLLIKSTYENAQGNQIESTSSSLKNLTVEIVDGNGNRIDSEGVFSALGEYTITVSSGSIKDSYVVYVQGINIATVEGAIAVGNFFKSEVVSGTQKVKEAIKQDPPHDMYDYSYEYGDNYVRVEEKLDSHEIQHFSIDGEGIFSVSEVGGNIVSNNNINANMINGAPIKFWYAALTEYGVENALSYLYSEAKKCTNKDLEETADEQTRQYSFSFSGLIFSSSNSDYFETTVNFLLGEKYNVESVTITQLYWENNETGGGANGEEPLFKTDENGITVPNRSYPSQKLDITVEQVAGRRTAVNPYNRNMFKVQGYDLTYLGNVLGDNGTVKCNMEGTTKQIKINIANIAPQTAQFTQDPLYFSLQGSSLSEVDSVSGLFANANGISAYRNGNAITVTFYHGGVYTLVLRTANTRKTITFDVTGLPPTSMKANIYNESAGLFSAGSTKTISLNGYVYFYGAVNDFANPAQNAYTMSSNAGSADIEKVTINGIECFKFSATEEGEYEVVVMSAVSSQTCRFIFTVSDIPDYEQLLKGKYSVVDRAGNIFEVTFASATETSGTVTVVKTPTETDGTPITLNAQTANYSYVVDLNNLAINLTLVSGTNLGVKLNVNADGKLVLIDQYNDGYVLVAE